MNNSDSTSSKEEKKPLFVASVQPGALIAVVLLLLAIVYFLIQYENDVVPVARTIDMYLLIFLGLSEIVLLLKLSPVRYEFFESYMRVSRRREISREISYSDISQLRAIKAGINTRIELSIKGDMKTIKVPDLVRKNPELGIGLADWLKTKVPRAMA
jgi:hypothetical protein